MILLSLLFVSFMFKAKQGSAWTLHCKCVTSLSELPVSSIALCLPGSKNPHLITNWGPAAFTEAELEERQRSWKGKKATSEWQWQLTCGPEQEPTSPRSALHRAASCLQGLVCSAGWAFLLMKCCLPCWRVCSELSHYSGWCLTGHAVFPHFSKTLQLKICIEM